MQPDPIAGKVPTGLGPQRGHGLRLHSAVVFGDDREDHALVLLRRPAPLGQLSRVLLLHRENAAAGLTCVWQRTDFRIVVGHHSGMNAFITRLIDGAGLQRPIR